VSAAAVPSTSAIPPCDLATFDRFGETLVATLTVQRLSAPEGADLACALAAVIARDGAARLVLDVQNVNWMDSSGVGSLLELFSRLRSVGGRIALVSAGQNIESLFRLTHLDRVFPICRDVVSAIETLERSA